MAREASTRPATPVHGVRRGEKSKGLARAFRVVVWDAKGREGSPWELTAYVLLLLGQRRAARRVGRGV